MNFVDRSKVKTGVHLTSVSHFVCQGTGGHRKFQVAAVGGSTGNLCPGANNAGVEFVFKQLPRFLILHLQLPRPPLSDEMPGDLSQVVGFTLPDRPVRSLKLYGKHAFCLCSSTPPGCMEQARPSRVCCRYRG